MDNPHGHAERLLFNMQYMKESTLFAYIWESRNTPYYMLNLIKLRIYVCITLFRSKGEDSNLAYVGQLLHVTLKTWEKEK